MLGFQNRPEFDRTLAATTSSPIRRRVTPRSDIFFNSAFTWSTSDAGVGRFDVESIALHEIGHLFGLSFRSGRDRAPVGRPPSSALKR